jgi:Na+/glutamate symporter
LRRRQAEQQENAGEVEETEDEDTDGNEGESTAEVTAGSITGGIVGAVGAALLLPGIGPAIAGGALTVALAGAAVGGIAGGLLGAFARIGVSREKAKYYEREFKAGNVILTVTAHDQAQEARASEILQSHGAHDVASHSK